MIISRYNWILFSILLFLTVHLRIFSLGEFEISLGILLFPIWLILTFRSSVTKFSRNSIYFYLVLVFLPFLNFLFVISYSFFFKSLFYYYFSITLIFIFWYKREIKISFLHVKDFLKIFQILLLLISSLQFYTVTISQTEMFFNLFGNLQMKEGVFEASNAWFRVKSVYLEPSYFAFVLISLFVSDVLLKYKITFLNFCLTSIMLYYTGSSFGLVTYCLLIFYWLAFVLNIQYLRYFIIFGSAIFISINFTNLLILTRLSEVITSELVFNNELSSGFMRLILPMYILLFIFSNGTFLGIPLGNLNLYLEVNKFYYSDILSIHNGLFAFFIYFGIIAILVFIILFYKFFKVSKLFQFFIIFFVLGLMNSGSIFYPLTYLFLLILPLTCIQLDKEKNNKYYNYLL